MPIYRTITVALLLYISATTFGQINGSTDTTQKATSKEKNISFRKRIQAKAKEQIVQLKDGALLIRLQTKQKQISILRKNGNNKLADEIEIKQRNYNLKIVSAFKTDFNFCPTYFFFSDYSQNIRERQFDKVVFLSENLLADTTIKFSKSHFLTAEFGTIEQDTAKYFSYNSYEPNANWSLKTVSNYYGGSNMGFGALIIKSDQLIQLRDPFPYYVRTFDSLPNKRRPSKTVRRMNKKLHGFYDKENE